jgi:hypothetical protein
LKEHIKKVRKVIGLSLSGMQMMITVVSDAVGGTSTELLGVAEGNLPLKTSAFPDEINF